MLEYKIFEKLVCYELEIVKENLIYLGLLEQTNKEMCEIYLSEEQIKYDILYIQELYEECYMETKENSDKVFEWVRNWVNMYGANIVTEIVQKFG